MQDLKCLEWDPELFFPERGTGCRPGTWRYEVYITQIATAKSVCAGCDLRLQCLETGLDEPVGIWGGLTEDERAELRQQRSRQRAVA